MRECKERRSLGDRGDTLIELLIAIVVIGLTVSALLGSLMQSTAASLTHRNLTSLDAVLKSFAESAKYDIQLTPGTPEFADCATTSSPPYAVLGTPSPSSGSVNSPVTIFATGFNSSSFSMVKVGGLQAAVVSQTAAPTGSVGDEITFTVPSGLTVGQSYPVTAYYSGGSISSTNGLTITSGAPVDSVSPLSGYSLGITEIDWWNTSTNKFDNSTGSCAAADKSGVQLLTVTAKAPDNSSAKLAFAVSNPTSTIPVFTSATSTNFSLNGGNSFTVTATGQPSPVITESGSLPAGVTFNSATGVLSGTPAAGSNPSYSITFTATNVAGSVNQSFTLNVVQPPAITSANNTAFAQGSAGSFQVVASGSPSPTFSETGTLPTGVTFSASGLLSGTPGAGTIGSYPITITATNGVNPPATQNFTLTVGQAPAFTSAPSATFTVGTNGTFHVTASGSPAPTFAYTGVLPNGVVLSATGTLSGTPGAGTGGSYNITITASNGVSPNATQAFTLTVDQAPAITSAGTTTFAAGAAGNFQVAASGYPSPTYSEVGSLPPGVTFSAGGVISGTPAVGSGGSYPISITASNGVSPNATQSFTLKVDEAPKITSPNATTFTVGQNGSFQFTASGYPASTFTTSGLPSGVTLSSNGLLAGTPATGTGGVYTITVTAANGVSPNATQTFTLTVDEAPSVASSFSTKKNRTFSFSVITAGYPAPTVSFTGTLPTGVSLSSSGVLSGRSTSSGTWTITIKATNGVSPDASQSFTLTVTN